MMDRIILGVSLLLSVYGLLFFIPSHKLKEAVILFFFTQLLTWSFSLIFVELGMISNPVREFTRATGANFTFNFVVYPTVSTLFGIYYPYHKNKWKQFVYQMVVIGGLATIIWMVAIWTELIEYPKFTWVTGAMVLLLGLNSSRKYCLWFFGAGGKKGA